MLRSLPRPRRAAFAAALLFGLAAPAGAQTPAPDGGASWTVADAVGYGGLGFGLGLAIGWGIEGDEIGPPVEALFLIGATTTAGILTGATIGRHAERAVAAGRPVGGAHRAAALGGAVAAGAILGSLAAVPLINGEGQDTPLGSDERTVLTTTIAGAGLGALWGWRNADELAGRDVAVAPTVTRDGAVGVAVRARLGR